MRDPIHAPSQVRAFLALALYPFLAMTRSVGTVAFGFLFPIAFIGVFGFIGGGPQELRLGLAAGADRASPLYAALQQLPGARLVEAEPAELDRQLRLGKLDAMLELEPADLRLRLSSANPQGQYTRLVLDALVDRLNLRLAGVEQPPLRLEVQEVSGRSQRYLDFALPGQIGFALLSTATFGTVFGLLYLKKTLVLKRMFATPTRGITILLGQGVARLLTALLQMLSILVFGVVFFHFQLANGLETFLSMLALAALGLVVFLGFGLLIAGRTDNQESAAPMTNLVGLSQFLLSGSFFPTDVFPQWLQTIADHLPLTYLNVAMRQVATEGASLLTVWPSILGLLAWGALAYALTIRTFRWE
ncbi:MAG: ABC transporter permease [Chloroflexi bacterium]|nr:ABC transporter permease [Chloroflexota bacterium]